MRCFFTYTLPALLLAGCGAPREQAPQGAAAAVERQALLEVNRLLSEREQEVLAAYVARQRLNMRQAPEGYYCEVVARGRGAAVAEGCAVRLHGRVMLLDGALCYAYGEERPLEVRVGAHLGLRGLNVALLGVREGSRVRFVFPAHMAYGLPGDGDRIPPRSPLVCELTVERVVAE